jgi:uncharacterized repeat protein (TIGR02543 family)
MARTIAPAAAHLTVTAPVLYTLTVAIAGSAGYGRVDGYADSDSGDSIFCSASQSDSQCSHSYRPGAVVHLAEATEALDSIFDGWSGPCSGTGEFCDVKMDSDQTVTATFNQIS